MRPILKYIIAILVLSAMVLVMFPSVATIGVSWIILGIFMLCSFLLLDIPIDLDSALVCYVMIGMGTLMIGCYVVWFYYVRS